LIQFFTSASCDASGNGEGAIYIGEKQITTDANGDSSFYAILDSAEGYVSATATDPDGNTSEFSACVEIIAAPQATNVSVQASISLAREFNLESGEFMATRSLVDSPAAIKVDYLTSGSAEPDFDYATLKESVLILPN